MREIKKKKVLILSGISWCDTFQRHQRIANYLSQNNEVYFLEGIMSSKISFKKIFEFIFRKLKKKNNKSKNQEKKINLKIYNYKLLNPILIFRYYNYKRIDQFLSEIGCEYDMIINYLPIETTKYLINKIKYKYLIYDCVRDFESWDGYPKNIKEIEKYLIEKSNYILVDSFWIKDKICNLYKNTYIKNKVIQILPTINNLEKEIYMKNFLVQKKIIKRITYFGFVGEHIDIDTLNFLAEYFDVYIIGEIEKGILLSKKITIIPFISNEISLANKIIEISDGIILPYKKNKGVIPTKFMQSLATGLPVFMNKYYETKKLENVLYVYEKKEELLSIIKNFEWKEFDIKRNKYKKFIEKNVDEYAFKFLGDLL